uniref:Uncharacterized protein n=1 Tax=Nelumbo nucifera TaxID=4432 RepID=A0A822XFN0_NELNU|nr:TPA_asm: hypothetical protein HUJ06_020480 [Nelumbo nucifera]
MAADLPPLLSLIFSLFGSPSLLSFFLRTHDTTVVTQPNSGITPNPPLSHSSLQYFSPLSSNFSISLLSHPISVFLSSLIQPYHSHIFPPPPQNPPKMAPFLFPFLYSMQRREQRAPSDISLPSSLDSSGYLTIYIFFSIYLSFLTTSLPSFNIFGLSLKYMQNPIFLIIVLWTYCNNRRLKAYISQIPTRIISNSRSSRIRARNPPPIL